MKPLPPGRSHLSAAERRTVSRLHQILSQPGLLHGSLRVNRRRCGKESCKCASGDLHASLVLSIVEKGRQISIHVPAPWEPVVREWVERDRRVRDLLLELSAMYRDRLRNREESPPR